MPLNLAQMATALLLGTTPLVTPGLATAHAAEATADTNALTPDQQVLAVSYTYINQIYGLIEIGAPDIFAGPLGIPATLLKNQLGTPPAPGNLPNPFQLGSLGTLWFSLTQMMESQNPPSDVVLYRGEPVASLIASMNGAKKAISSTPDDDKARVYLLYLQSLCGDIATVLNNQIIPQLEQSGVGTKVKLPDGSRTLLDLAKANLDEVNSTHDQAAAILAMGAAN